MKTRIPTTIDIKFWIEMARFIVVAIVLIVFAGNLTYFSEMFQSVEPKVTGTILWCLFILFALRYLQTPDIRRKKENHNGKTNAILQSRKTPNKNGYEGNHMVHQTTIPKKIIKEIGWKKGDIITMNIFGKILKMECNNEKKD